VDSLIFQRINNKSILTCDQAMKNKYIQVQTTVGSEEEAFLYASSMVKMNLVACVHYYPIKSIYRWKGQIEKSDEFLLLIKAPLKNKDKIIDYIKQEHSYEIPEILVLEFESGSKEYLDWIDEETKLD
jgi:periplasmic divalent cation tolerance protein